MVVRGRGDFAPGSSTPHIYVSGPQGDARKVGQVNAFERGGSRVQEYRVLKGMQDVERAMALLRRIAEIVKPIMVKYDFKLPLLREFFPAQHNLLGVNINGGQQICIRLRYPENKSDFLPEEDLVQTMLHELTHNVRGPHDEIFWNFFHKISVELEDRQRLGRWDGEGFMTGGARLGEGTTRNLPPHEAKALALRKAEERRRQQGLMGSGRLGGASSEVDADPRLAAQKRAEAAARRRHEEKTHVCPSTQAEVIEIEEEVRQEERRNGVLVITIDDDSDDEGEVQRPTEATHDAKNAAHVKTEDGGQDDSVEFAGMSLTSAERRSPAAPPQPPPQPTPEVIVIDSDSDDSQPTPAPPPTKRARPTGSSAPGLSLNVLGARSAAALRATNAQRSPSTSSATHIPASAPAPAPARTWPCQTCTLLNAPRSMSCDACGTPRPTAGGAARVQPRPNAYFDAVSFAASASATPAVGPPPPPGTGWTCRACGFVMRGEAEVFWSCTRCGVVKRT